MSGVLQPAAASALPPLAGLDEALADRLTVGLGRVESLLREVVDHDDPFIAQASAHLAQAGGKRFRPLLTLLAAEVGDGITEQVVQAAVGVELTHLASLYHDDVMDEAVLRRGATSANLAFGNSTAILVGDLLFGTASQVVSRLGAEAVRIQADTFVRLCAGQIRDARPTPDGADPVQHYLGVLADKTGSLIATSARYGAMFGGCDESTISTLTAYGERIGVVFQLADDLLDVASDATESGKTPGADLREGKATLPVLHVRASDNPDDGRLQELLSGPVREPEDLAEALGLLRGHSAMGLAEAETLRQAQAARELLAPLPPGPAVDALRALVDGIAVRSS